MNFATLIDQTSFLYSGPSSVTVAGHGAGIDWILMGLGTTATENKILLPLPRVVLLISFPGDNFQ